jgi:hypothetical protein
MRNYGVVPNRPHCVGHHGGLCQVIQVHGECTKCIDQSWLRPIRGRSHRRQRAVSGYTIANTENTRATSMRSASNFIDVVGY